MAEKKKGRQDPDLEGGGEDEEVSGVRELIELGKTKGYVTLDDVHEALDPEMVEQDDIMGVLAALREGHLHCLRAHGCGYSTPPKRFQCANSRQLDHSRIGLCQATSADDPPIEPGGEHLQARVAPAV